MDAVITIDRCKDIVSHINRSGWRHKLPETPKQEVVTRWNSHRRMLTSVEIQWDEVCISNISMKAPALALSGPVRPR